MKVKLPLDEFPAQGIAVVTLYNGNGQPVAERLVYVHPEKKLYITAEPDKTVYATREKVNLKIKVVDEKGQPVIAQLGISVFDAAYDNPGDLDNLLTHCFLSSQIRGRIYAPAYYFDEKNPGRAEALDLLLLTQGWRRYVWKAENLSEKGAYVITDELVGHQTVKDKKMKGTEQFIQIFGSDGDVRFTLTDINGDFAIEAGILNDFRKGNLYIKPMLQKKHGTQISFKDLFPVINQIRGQKEMYYPLPNRGDSVSKKDFSTLVTGMEEIVLKELIVTAKARRFIRDKVMGSLDSLMEMDFNSPWVCIHGFLENYREGYSHLPFHENHLIQVLGGDSLNKRNKPIEGHTYHLVKYSPLNNGKPGLDGLYVADHQDVIYHKPYYSDKELLELNNLWRIKGYYGRREFYLPDETDMLDPLPDSRNTLFWAPSVLTDTNGEANLSFYCSDLNTRFTGQIEGLADGGLLGVANCEFRVFKISPSFKMHEQ
ncbi:MAG: hypothetical protein LBB84_04415 [Tannerellaceae bacterium]|nr:hypothetical protein [Tannerellaceae bacterium]